MILFTWLLYAFDSKSNETNTISVNGTNREFFFYAKGNPDKLIVFFHGTNGNPTDFFQASWSSSLDNVAIAAPVSAIGPSRFEWYLVLSQDVTSDVDLFDAIVSATGIQKVYAVGFSAGAIMASHLAFRRADSLSAVAILSGGFVSTPKYKVQTLPPLLVYTGGPRDAISFFNFTTSTNVFLRSVATTNAEVYLCTHTQGHTVPEQVSSDVYQFFLGNNASLSSSCTKNMYKFDDSVNPFESVASYNIKGTFLNIVGLFLVNLMI